MRRRAVVGLQTAKGEEPLRKKLAGNRGGTYAKRVAFVGSHWIICFLSDSISPVVAAAYIGCGLLSVGMARVPEKENFKVAHYGLVPRSESPLPLSARLGGMIIGTHVLLYSENPEADRAFFRDVLEFPAVDAGGGWLIFGMSPAEMGIHPAERNKRQVHGGRDLLGAVIYLMCDDLSAMVRSLQARKVTCSPIEEEEWGIKTLFCAPQRRRGRSLPAQTSDCARSEKVSRCVRQAVPVETHILRNASYIKRRAPIYRGLSINIGYYSTLRHLQYKSASGRVKLLGGEVIPAFPAPEPAPSEQKNREGVDPTGVEPASATVAGCCVPDYTTGPPAD
jgi:hypothetical protein